MSRRTPRSEPESCSPWLSDPRVLYAGLWLLSVALQISVTPDWLIGSVRIVDPPADCVLAAGSGWSSPLSRLAEGHFSECPAILLLLITAAFLARVAIHLAASAPAWLVAVFLCGASLTIQPPHLIPAGLIFVMSLLVRSKPDSAIRILTGGTILAVLLTIEFGVVALIAAGLWLDTAAHQSRRGRVLPETGGLALGGILMLTMTGTLNDFAATLLRPFSWLWIPVHLVGLQSTGPVFPDGVTALPAGLLLLFLVATWSDIARQSVQKQSGRTRQHDDSTPVTSDGPASPAESSGPLPVWTVLILSLIGLCCGRFFWLCVCSIAAVDARQTDRPAQPWLLQSASMACLTFALAAGAWLLQPESNSPLPSAVVTDVVDPAAWEITGNVLLTDLDQSPDWQSSLMRNRFRLIIDDRWDVFADRYRNYSHVCRDLFEVRADSYLRTDGRYGGYKTFVREWSPVLLVASSSQLDRIRQLSLSPDWTTLSIDGRRTIFGRSNDPQIAFQRQRASETLLAMEWPTRSLDSVDAVIVAGTDDNLRRVAEVLCAIRLPYAALRSLPSDDLWPTQKIRVWCFLELAHRTKRHSGQTSLLDQFRALALVREIHNAGEWDVAEQLRVARSLEGLEQFDLATLLCEAVEHNTSSATGRQQQAAAALRRQMRTRNRIIPPTEIDQALPLQDRSFSSTADEIRLRQALAAGQAATADGILPGLTADRAALYSLVTDSRHQSAGQPAVRILQALDSINLPENRSGEGKNRSGEQKQPNSSLPARSEACFWLGCLAIEAGNAKAAEQAFLESERLHPQSPLRHLRSLHQQRLR